MIASTDELWGTADLVPGDELERVLGSLTLRLRRLENEVWVHETHDPEAVPEQEDWMRWALPVDRRLELRPSLPDRLVVVSPEQPFHLPPRGEAAVFVRIPLFVGLFAVDPSGDEAELARLPSMVLSDTWWGTFVEGEVAYWLTTKARRAAPPEIFEPHLTVCPLLLGNRADEPLPIDRFAVRVAHLTLFRKGEALWTDEVRVRYEGAQEGSEIHYTGRVPQSVGSAVRIAAPSVPPPRGLQALTFGRIRALSGW